MSSLRSDRPLRLMWAATLAAIFLLVLGKGRWGAWERPIQAFLGLCLVGMGVHQFRRLIARGWWKGHWRTTLRHQKPEEGAALLVAFNVFLIGVVCLAVVALR